MLMWLADDDKRSLLPRTVDYRTKLAVAMEGHLHVEEIVGFPDASPLKSHREDALDVESSKRVARRMQAKDIIIPPHRQVRPEDRRYDLSEVSRHWHKELLDLEKAFQAGKFSKRAEESAAEPEEGHPHRLDVRLGSEWVHRKKSIYTPEYRRMAVLRSTAKTQNVRIAKTNLILKDQEKIDKMDLDLHREDVQPSEKEELIKALQSSIQDYKNVLATLDDKMMTRLFFLDDDRRAFAMDPPLLMWDRRQAEPLLAREDEFHAPRKVALLDFQPKATDEYPLTAEQSTYFDLISTSLLGPSGHQTFQYVKTIAPGAFEALVPKVPAIRDPRKGGRYDIESLRVRTATPEMFHGLALAWDNWAFKPPIESQLTRFGAYMQGARMERIGAIVRV